jgi:hypothetical protein
MEVHAHTHTPRKKWTHYFREFIMLFLAVFCGFIAENKREHYIEHKREKAFMKTLLNDLQADIYNLDSNNSFRLLREKSLDSLMQKLSGKDLKKNAKQIYRLALATDGYETFYRNDRTIQQLKHSGSMRYIRSEEVASFIMDYDNYIITEIDWNNRTEATRVDYYKQLRYQLMDAGVLYRLNQAVNPDEVAYTFLQASPSEVNSIAGSVFQLIRISETNRDCGQTAKQKAQYLAELIKKEYRLE